MSPQGTTTLPGTQSMDERYQMATSNTGLIDQSELSSGHLELILQLQRETLEQIANHAPTASILKQICSNLERTFSGSTVTIRLFDNEQNQLTLACAPSLSSAEQSLIDTIAPGPGQGSAAYAVMAGTPTCSEDVNTDPRWTNVRPLAKSLGLGSSWAWPITGANNNVEGALSISQRKPGLPSPLHIQLLETAAHLAGIAIRREQTEQALRSTTVRLHQITNALPGVVFQYRQSLQGQRRFTFFSHQSDTLLGIRSDSVLACADELLRLIHPEDRDACEQALQRSIQFNIPWQQELRLTNQQGKCIWLQVSAILDVGNRDEHIWNGIFLDITNVKNSAEQLHVAAIAFATTSEGILITGPEDRITEVNEAFCNITGYSRGELLGQTPALLRSNRHSEQFFQQVQQSLSETSQWSGEIWNKHKDGDICLHHLNIQLIKDDQEQLLHKVAVYTDINRQRESEQKLKYLNDHDTLTHLPNRQLFNTVLQQWLRHQPTLTVMVLDLDRFKHINESLGHEAGDQLLTQVADLLRQQMTPVDVLARLGGNEFAILLPMIDCMQEAQQIAELLVSSLDRPFEVCGRRYFNTVSIGIAQAPAHGNSVDQLTRHADTALSHAKSQGRNRYSVFCPELGKQVDTWLKLEPELRNALEQEQFLLYYQPQVDGHSSRIIGAEALIRWQHPDLGMVSPGDFLPIAEEIGLMPRLGQWVLKTACQQLSLWHKRGLENFRLSINLAGQQIMQGGLAALVATLLEEHALPAAMLELEILETFVMENEAHTASVLTELRELGIELALDDFGTGYSSLAYLKKLPIQKVKIDQSLVRDIPDDPNDEAIARAVIALGRSLSLKVCAEGVETDAQHQFLRNEACDQLQGYLFSRPLPPNDLESLLRDKALITR